MYEIIIYEMFCIVVNCGLDFEGKTLHKEEFCNSLVRIMKLRKLQQLDM